MKMTKKEILANRIYEEDASEVLDFLSEVAPEKQSFRDESSFLNFTARELQPLLKKAARSDKQNSSFWKNRAMSMDINHPINKKKNVLWCIRLLSGKCKVPQN